MYTVVIEYPNGDSTAYDFEEFDDAVEIYKEVQEKGATPTLLDDFGDVLVVK